MSGDNLDNILSEMNLEDAESLRTKLTKNISKMRSSGNMSLTVFVPARLKESFFIARKWAFEKELIKSNSKYAFAKFAVINTIQIILEEIEKERNAPPEPPEIPTDQEEPIIA